MANSRQNMVREGKGGRKGSEGEEDMKAKRCVGKGRRTCREGGGGIELLTSAAVYRLEDLWSCSISNGGGWHKHVLFQVIAVR
eukprot:767395-Hanusia_phi.AAC.2